MGLGVSAVHEVVDFDTAALVAEELGAKVEKEVHVTIEERLIETDEDPEESQRKDALSLSLWVTLTMVRHLSSTESRNALTLLDTEAGGITQISVLIR